MTPKLTQEQHDALQAQPGAVVYFRDVEGEQEYAVIPADTFQKVRALLGGDAFAISDTYAPQEEALSKVWNDPELDAYNQALWARYIAADAILKASVSRLA